MSRFLRLAALLLYVALVNGDILLADEPAYFRVRAADLTLTEGNFEKAGHDLENWNWRLNEARMPWVTVDDGEAYLSDETAFRFRDRKDNWGAVCIRLPQAGRDVVGRIYFPTTDGGRFGIAKFKISADQASAEAREDFLQAKIRHYQSLQTARVAGGAWFRHLVVATQKELDDQSKATPNRESRPPVDRFDPYSDFDDTYALFSGGRAVSENLQLDRVLVTTTDDKTLVDVGLLKGVTIQEIDWKPLIAGKQPTLDPLSSAVPADQHVVFFPTFTAAAQLSDELDRRGTLVLQAAEPRSEDSGVVARYQRQLGLKMTDLGRLLGPQVIDSLAITGGDPYFRLGTDVAILFASKNPAALRTMLIGQITLNLASEKGWNKGTGEIGDVPFDRWVSDDRRVSSYLAVIGDAVVVTNSFVQLQRLVDVRDDKSPAIASLDEYKFFRDRYKLGEANETALLFLSDATIRRWCSPKWRIADSRRTRDLAVLAEVQAAHLDELVRGTTDSSTPIDSPWPLSQSGELVLGAAGVRSSTVGSLDLMTPIAELLLDQVTKSEAQAYERWRDGYQRNFSWAFDPIALRISLTEDALAADLTVMPLIDASDYRTFIEISRGVRLKPESGDPHGALIHAVMAFNKDAETVKRNASFASAFAPQLRVDPLSWIGESIALYVDDSPMWDEMVKDIVAAGDKKSEAELERELMQKYVYKLPIALRIEVSSPLKATAFVASLRAFIEQSAPGMTRWESVPYGETAYVKISPTERIEAGIGDDLKDAAIYYSLTPAALTLSLNEDVVKGSLDRDAARAAAAKKPAAEKPSQSAAATKPWLGESLAFAMNLPRPELLEVLFHREYQAQMQRLAWGNLPILNEWHRLYSDEDPAALHERLWKTRLVDPAGGQYVWNEAYQTMESTLYGHPGEPKAGPAAPPIFREFSQARYGLTFEEQGLRAKGELTRKK